ncbi:MAG TPA: hypothetical protein VJA21_05030 [Verrucomicrobiae bacterium]
MKSEPAYVGAVVSSAGDPVPQAEAAFQKNQDLAAGDTPNLPSALICGIVWWETGWFKGWEHAARSEH